MNVFMTVLTSLVISSVITVMSLLPGLADSSMFSTAEAADVHSYPTVAVMQFGNKAITSQGMRKYDFDSASEYAIYQLVASGWFDLVDYEQLGNIAKMHEINMSGLVDQSTAVQLGKFAGAQFMMVGNVTGLTTKKSGMNYQHGSAGGAGVDVRTVIANVAVRLVDIETGKIVGAGLGKGESASSSVEVVFKKYRKPRADSGYSSVDYGNASDVDGSMGSVEYKGASASTGNGESVDYGEQTGNSGGDEDGVGGDDGGLGNDYDSYSAAGTVEKYSIKIGTETFSAVQVRNAISKAVRDAIYGDMGLMTMLNDGKKLKVKTGF